jgi:parvulin-like peptidyl-prolyl isomerase
MRTPILKALLLAVILGAGALPLWAQAPAPVATVNGEKIDEQAFVNLLKARYGDRVLNAITGNMAIRQAARAAGIVVTKDEVERRFMTAQRAIETRAPMTGENFKFWLAKQGLNREYFMTELYDQMLLEKMVAGQVSVSDADVASFYERNKQQLAEPATVRIAHICVKTEQEAQAIRSDILAKKITWDEAAKKYSLDPWTKDTGGDMGFVGLADTDFHKAAFALRNNGDISAPVQSPMGVHILKRLEFKEARVPKFEEVQQSLREQMVRRQTQLLGARKREEILKNAKIEIITKLPTEAPPPAAAPATPAPAAP